MKAPASFIGYLILAALFVIVLPYLVAIIVAIIKIALALLAVAVGVALLIKFGPTLVLRLQWLLSSLVEQRPVTSLAFEIWRREIEHRRIEHRKKKAESDRLKSEADRLENEARLKEASERQQRLQLEVVEGELARALRPTEIEISHSHADRILMVKLSNGAACTITTTSNASMSIAVEKSQAPFTDHRVANVAELRIWLAEWIALNRPRSVKTGPFLLFLLLLIK